MSRIVLRDLSVVVTVDPDDTVLREVSLAIEDGVITALGEVEARAGDEVIDGRGRLALPGFVNLHTHLPMTLLRGIAEGVDLQGFLERVWAAEGAVMDPPTVELGATLGALESLLGGCTTQLDMYFHHEAAHRGAVAAGARHVGGPTFFDGAGPDGLAWEERMTGLRAWPELLAEIGGPQVPVAAMPHATYTNSVEHLAELVGALRELATLDGGDGGHGQGGHRHQGGPPLRPVLHTHLSENAAENADIAARFEATPTELLARAGILDRDTALDRPRVVVGHGVHLSDGDRADLAAADASVGHCPASNLKLASGALDWARWRADGIRLGIGTDGCASSNDLDMWQAMRAAAHLAALTSHRPDIPATEILRAATIEGAAALGMDHLIGSLEVGKRADLTIIDLEQPHLTPVHDVVALLVHAAGRGDVTDVFVDGRIVVRERRSTLLDTPALLEQCRDRARAAAAAQPLPPASEIQDDR